MERDISADVKIVNIFISTHTLTWSVTTRFTSLALYYTNFNSHAHVERDSKIDVTTASGNISTHTLTWSVTNGVPSSFNTSSISTHTLTWSVTAADMKNAGIKRISTHTLTWSVTLQWQKTPLRLLFQLTRSRGA